LTKTLPREETYGLVAQMRRAAISIPSNVAEGFNRIHNGEYRQFLYITLGSCAELETQIEISAELGYVRHEAAAQVLSRIEHESRMLTRLIRTLR
jgi:four helix bundle protein